MFVFTYYFDFKPLLTKISRMHYNISQRNFIWWLHSCVRVFAFFIHNERVDLENEHLLCKLLSCMTLQFCLSICSYTRVFAMHKYACFKCSSIEAFGGFTSKDNNEVHSLHGIEYLKRKNYAWTDQKYFDSFLSFNCMHRIRSLLQ